MVNEVCNLLWPRCVASKERSPAQLHRVCGSSSGGKSLFQRQETGKGAGHGCNGVRQKPDVTIPGVLINDFPGL